jgi:trans-L-3-hydroxyproline dehydratase
MPKTDLSKLGNWRAPRDWVSIRTLDCHTAGEPFRIITGGLAELGGETILDKRRHMQNHLDHLRTALMWEPRGHADMYGCVITPPVSPDADFGVLFLHNEGYSTMCGHGIIGVATAAVETGMVPVRKPETCMAIDAPAGLIRARVQVSDDGRAGRVFFQNVPSFVLALDETVQVPGLGRVRYDIAFGGAFYAFVQAADVGLNTVPGHVAELIAKGMAIKRAVMAAQPVAHPFEADLSFLYGTIFIGPAHSHDAHSSNVCIFAQGEVDRSPTGTGVSARLALHHARGELEPGQVIDVQSVIGTRFSGRIVQLTTFGPYAAVIPEVSGTAHITGRHEFLIDPRDPLQKGFFLR